MVSLKSIENEHCVKIRDQNLHPPRHVNKNIPCICQLGQPMDAKVPCPSTGTNRLDVAGETFFFAKGVGVSLVHF